MMSRVIKSGIAVLVIVSLFLVVPVAAAINTITTGATVFIGEDGLDVTGAMGGDTRIGWWASGASPTTSSPDYTVAVPNPADFYVSPTDFVSRTGAWYRLDSLGNVNEAAFTVTDPLLVLKVEDTTVGVDVTDKWVPTGDSLRFRIETNLISISSQRPGVSSTPITIKAKSPTGAIYTSLVNSAGISTSTVDIPVTSTPYFTGSIWDTGRVAVYPTGTYTLWAECNVNFMNDRYGETGKTISREVSLINQEQNPLYQTRTPTPTPTTPVTTSPPTQTTTVSQTTQVTAIPTTPAPTEPTTMITTQVPPPTPTQTQTPGFEGILAGAALIAGLILFLRKE
jgi:hypothetical protein